MSAPRSGGRRSAALAAWGLLLIVALVLVWRTPFLTDMTVFLPRHPSAQQALLIDSMQRGQAAQTLLARATGVPEARRLQVSRELASRWRAVPSMVSVLNGDLKGLEADRRWLFEARYLLAPQGVDDPFSVARLRADLQAMIAQLAGSAGLFGKDQLLRDPTGASLAAMQAALAGEGGSMPTGPWIGPDGSTLLFLLQSGVSGNDLDAQQALLESLAAAATDVGRALGLPSLQVQVSGAASFAVESRRAIRDDVMRLSMIGLSLIVLLMLAVFRSWRVLLLTLVPIGSAVLAGAAAVSLAFGSLHGLTLGFGAALIGETVDYAIYYLASLRHPQVSADPSRAGDPRARRGAFWSVIGLGLATSLVGFSALLFSGFPGLAQLAVFAMAGLVAGFAAARWVLPALTPAGLRPRGLPADSPRMLQRLAGLARWRRPLLVLLLGALVWSVLQRDALWDRDIASLNPVDRAAADLDRDLRQALGQPGSRVLVVIRTQAGDAALLEAADAVAARLEALRDAARLGGFDSPTRILPAPSRQAARQAGLPPPAELAARLQEAALGLPLSAKALQGFARDVEQARTRAPLTRRDLAGTRLGARLEAMMPPTDAGQVALLPLRPVGDTPIDIAGLTASLPPLANASVTVLDLKAEADALYAGYLQEAVWLSLAGALAIVVLLAWRIRSARRLAALCLPVMASLVLVIAGHLLVGKAMNLLHLVGLMLIVAIGSNYALVMVERAKAGDGASPVLASLLLANLTTLCGYGALAMSTVPLLAALGTTVGLGAPLVLLLSAIWMGDNQAQRSGR